jgi:hypothetical protein
MVTETQGPESDLDQTQVLDAYGAAFLLVLLSTLMLIAADAEIGSGFAAVAGLLQFAALIVTLRVSGARRRKSTIVYAIALVALAVAIVAVTTGGDSRTVVGLGLWLLLVLLTIAAIFRRLVTYRTLNVQFVLGLLTVHLLMGLSFGLAYLMSELMTAQAFSQGPQGLSGSIYFSFVTMTTLGYGDISPANPFVRALAVAEAVLGQIYLVSVVAFAVSRLGSATRVAQTEQD